MQKPAKRDSPRWYKVGLTQGELLYLSRPTLFSEVVLLLKAKLMVVKMILEDRELIDVVCL